jgi:histidinol-phosphate/aromatic aminotransferase/cobyric acid decarboxylase-like protein
MNSISSVVLPQREIASPCRLLSVGMANALERQEIYRMRHEVYARELGQHSENPNHVLKDNLDASNFYIVVRHGQNLLGFVSLTEPRVERFSVEKYFDLAGIGIVRHEGLYEVRLLTVNKGQRGSEIAVLLMYAAYRWVEARGGTEVIAIGRREVLELYTQCGLSRTGKTVEAGKVDYELLTGSMEALGRAAERISAVVDRLENSVEWRFHFAFRKPAPCFHGGAFFDAIGARFDHLSRVDEVINADVLDAWFPPAPEVMRSLVEHLPWLLRTSPPTHCEGLIEVLAQARGVSPGNIVPGAGSSDLIFRAFTHWLTARDHVLILDPTYGEYAHVLERVIGCTVDRFSLQPSNGFQLDLDKLQASFQDDYSLIVLVNPNSPTATHVDRALLEKLLRSAPQDTRVWVDETYIEYVGTGQSLERFAAASENVMVCKSMSKVYALSGTRAAYLCGPKHQLEGLRAVTPPWVIGLPTQLAAIRALESGEYYRERYEETKKNRTELEAGLGRLGWKVYPGLANFLLCEVPVDGASAKRWVKACRERNLFIRDASTMGNQLGDRFVRIAVKDRETNQKMLALLESVPALLAAE